MKPTPPMMMNASSHPKNFASDGMVSGATSAPTDAPELNTDVANARSFFGKNSAVTLIAAGKLPASPNARNPRHTRNSHTETDAIAPATAVPFSTARSAATVSTPSTNQHVAMPHPAWRQAASDQRNIAQR